MIRRMSKLSKRRLCWTILAVLAVVFVIAGTVQANQPPVADAGPDKETLVDEPVILEGSASDPDGDPIVDWLWEIVEQPAGATGVVSPPFMPNPSFIGNVAGDYVVALTVYDGVYWSLPDRVNITVRDNLPPTAVALADVTSGLAPLTVNFDGSDSNDPEERPLFYDWNFGDVEFSNEMSPTHVYSFPGEYEVTLLVRDDIRQGDTDRITITVTAGGTPPIADAGPDQTMYSGDILYLQGSGNDPDGGTIEVWQWSISQAPAGHDGTLANADTPTPAFSASVVGAYVISLYVIDSQREPSTVDFMVITVVENQPPEAVAAADVMSGPAPLTVNFDGTGSSDPEGGELFYNWKFGDGQVAVGPYPTHTYDNPGTYHVSLVVTDDGGLADFDIIDITVSAEALIVDIDVKPGSYPNAINLGSRGLTPVAILSEVGFDAKSVDPNTVELSGASVARRGKGGDKFMAHEEDVNEDGLVDLVVQVATADIDPSLLVTVEEDGVTYIYAVLTGKTYEGQNIEGEDEITIVPPEE